MKLTLELTPFLHKLLFTKCLSIIP